MKFGRYTIEEELPFEQFGVRDFRAYDPATKRYVRIKLFSPSSNPDGLLNSLRMAVGTPGQHIHQNAGEVYDIGKHKESPYIVTEYVKGEDLQQIINSAIRLPLLDKVRIMHQTAEALLYAHN
jgi:eukaryotic-like serine/threonine-protein kinase